MVDQLLYLVRKAYVTDPRDKVHGMLGLLPNNFSAQIEPEYSKRWTKSSSS